MKGTWQAALMSVISALRLSKTPATAFVCIGLFWGCFAAYVPEVKAQIGAGDGLFGVLLLATALGLLSAMWLAPRVDQLLGARSLQVGAVVFALSFVGPGLAQGPIGFVIAMTLLGAASGLLDVVMNARVGDLEAAHKRPLMNANHGMFSVGYACSAIATGIAREASVAPVVMFAAVAGVVMVLATRLNMAPAQETEDEAAVQGGYPLMPILLCGGVVLIAFMSEAAVETWSALHVERTLGGRAAEGALGPAMLGITMAIGRFSGQAVSERLSEFTVILGAGTLAAAGALIAAIAQTPLVAYIGFGTLGLGVSVIGPLGLALVGKLVSTRYRTEAISRAAVIGFAGFFVAPVLMGGISEVLGLRWSFVGVAVLLAGLIPLVAVLKRR